jgi:hypothetical protein
MKKLSLILLLTGIALYARAQNDPAKIASAPFFSGFQLRQSFQTPDQQLNPALVQLTIPGNGRDNWLVDAGISVTLGQLSQGSFTSKLVGEFHRNTLVDSQQYNYQLGYNFSIQHSKGNDHTVPVWTGNVKYIRDIVDSGHSVAASLNLALYRTSRTTTCIGRPGYSSDYKYTYQLNPSLEVQYQQVLASDKSATGAIIRPLLDLAASFAINKPMDPKAKIKTPSKLIEVSLDYDNRYAVVNSTKDGEGFSKLMKAGLSYYFFSTTSSSASVGASYNLGSDPLNGLKDQRFFLFALQVQF